MSELVHTITLETDRPTMPNFCCCCGDPATEEHRPEPPGRMRGLPEPESVLTYPYCAPCKIHLRAAQDKRTANLFAANLAIWGVAIPLAAKLPSVSLILGPAIGGYLYLKNRGLKLKASERCTAEGPAVKATWHRKHIYHFAFSRKETADAVFELNREAVADR